MSFGIYPPLVSPYFVSGTFQDYKSKVPDLDRRVEIAGIFKDGDRLLLPEETPQHLVLDRPGKQPLNIFQTENGAMVVSQALRDLMEEIDPGCHQFMPLKIDNLKDSSIWFILNVHAKQDSIVDEESDVEQRFKSTGKELMGIPAFRYETIPLKLTFKKSQMSNLNIWRERRYKGYLFCSDEFEREVRNRKMKFFKFRQAREI